MLCIFSDCVIYLQIREPYKATFLITDWQTSFMEHALTTLRHVVGARKAKSIVGEREAIAFEIAEIVGEVTEKWGVFIESVLIKEIILQD